MRKAFLCAVLVLVSVSAAFGGATEELLRAARDKNTTPRMIQNLIKFGADVNAKDNRSFTALMYASALNTDTEVVKALINAGADINAKDNDGKTVLDYAQNDEVKRIILDSGK